MGAPKSPKSPKVDVLRLVLALVGGALAGAGGATQLAPAPLPCPACPVCDEAPAPTPNVSEG